MASTGNEEVQNSLPLLPGLSTAEIASMTQTQLMQVALKRSLAQGSFVDTKFYAFSRRRSTGVVDEPRPIYANSAILKARSPYFAGLFNAGFKEAKVTPLGGGFPDDEESSTAEYDYASDSDLEDELDEEDDTADESLGNLTLGKRDQTAQPNAGISDTPLSSRPTNAQVVGQQHGRTILVPDVAFTTLNALLYFLFVGEVNFAYLSSQAMKTDSNQAVSQSWQAPQCSSKSMYRLADKYGISELKEKARADIMSKLSSENIVKELQSSLTSTYEQIRDMEVQFACESSRLPIVLAAIPDWMAEHATGKIPHATGVLTALFKKAASPSTTPPVDTRKQCLTCRTNSLNITQPIFRYCNSCGTYRNPL